MDKEEGIFKPILLNLLPFAMIPIESLSQHPIKDRTVNNLQYYFIEKGQGETIFFLHGFPDMANTWDESIAAFSGEYHCVAPFLRGYYPTAIAADGDYSPKSIGQDIVALADAMGIDRFYVVGQDWGASVAYAVMNLVPERVIKAVTVAIPHPRFIRPDFMTLYKARHFLWFANEKKSLNRTRRNHYRYLDKLYKRWSPGWKTYTETADLIKKTYSLEGRLEAALGYYWTFNRNRNDKELLRWAGKLPQMPLLTIAGKQDGALVFKPFYEMGKRLGEDFKLLIHEEAGHFLHREVPEYFIREVRAFLEE